MDNLRNKIKEDKFNNDFSYKLLDSEKHFNNIYKECSYTFEKGCGSYLFDGKNYQYLIEGYSKQKLLYEKSKIKENILEIGTFEGITSLNCSLNAKHSKVYTLDLPLNHSLDELQDKEYLDYDNDLINSDNRRSDILKNISNVIQLYGDSTKFDFSKTDYSMAFIDGGHDYQTVKSDTENILKYINNPGSVFWHDYDVTNDVGHYLLNISDEYDIKWIKNTRLCYLKVI